MIVYHHMMSMHAPKRKWSRENSRGSVEYIWVLLRYLFIVILSMLLHNPHFLFRSSVYLHVSTFYLKLRQLAIGLAMKYFNTIMLAKNPGDHPRTKHIQFVIANRQVNLEYVPTKHMAADGLTKALTGKKHSYFVRLLGMETRPSGSVKVV